MWKFVAEEIGYGTSIWATNIGWAEMANFAVDF
jgi:hypothetical protein